MAYKLALLLIFGSPAFYYGIKYTLLFAYRGIINKRIGNMVGMPAIAIGIYSLIWAIGFVYALGYLIHWLVL